MAFLLKVSNCAEAFLAELAIDDQQRLRKCWKQLEQNPVVDEVTRWNRFRSPILLAEQHCGDFLTLYHYSRYGAGRPVEVCECEWKTG